MQQRQQRYHREPTAFLVVVRIGCCLCLQCVDLCCLDTRIIQNQGAIYQSEGNLTISGHTSFVDNFAATGGAIGFIGGILTLDLEETGWFSGNEAIARGGAISISAADEVTVANVTFVSNTAKLGGAIFLDNPFNLKTRIYKNCTFIDNIATEGGAVFFSGGPGIDNVAGSVFSNNYAESGGAAYIEGTLNITDTSFVANKADDQGLAIYAARLYPLSGVDIAKVSFTRNAFYCDLGEYSSGATGANLTRFETVCRRCLSRDSTVPDSVHISNELETPSCEAIPSGTVARSSGTTIESLTLERGFFRTSNQSSIVMKCYRREACVGGVNPQKYCADGYEGAYCSVCAEGYSRGIAYSCKKCSTDARGAALGLTIFGALVVLLLIVILLRRLGTVIDDVTGEEADAFNGVARPKCAACQSFIGKVIPLSTIKIVVVVWQIVYQFSSIAEAVYPMEYEDFLSYISFTTFDITVIISYSCVFSPGFYSRLLLVTITPLVILLVLVGAYHVAIRKYRRSNSRMLVVRDQHLAAALFVVFFVYSSVSSTILQTFRCDTLDDGTIYLQADYRLTCSTAKHTAYTVYASLMFVVYPVGIPASFCWWLRRNSKHLQMSDRQSMASLQPFRSIWGTYRPSRYYYEVVECCRRITLSAASVIFIPNSVNQIAIVLSLAFVFLLLSETISPFERNADMNLYRWGNGVVMASLYVALLMKADSSMKDESEGFSVLGGVLIAANVGMIITILVQSVLLAQAWRDATIVSQEMFPSLRRALSVAPRRDRSIRIGNVENASCE